MKTRFKIRPEWCDSKEEETLIYEVLEYRGDRLLAKVEGNPFGFSIEPVESFEKRMINIIN